jgi:hypothetical protein
MRHRKAQSFLYFALVIPVALVACASDDDDSGDGNHAGQSTSAGSGGMPQAGSSSSGASGVNATGGSAGRPHAGAGGGASGGGSGTANAGKGGAGKGGGSAQGGSGDTSGGGEAGGGEPAPSSTWVNATGNLAGLESECGNLTLVSAMPDSELVIAGVAKRGLYVTSDGGKHWASLGSGTGSATITNRPSAIVYDPEDSSTFWEAGIYNGGGVYKTTDAGTTLDQLGTIAHNDLVSVDFTDPERKTLLAGGHEQKQTLYLSTDGGANFDQIGQQLPAAAHFSSYPLVLDDKTFLLGACGYGSGECGIYRSADAGQTWNRVSEEPVQARPLWASDGSIYWSIVYDGGLVRGNADGTSWTKVANNILTADAVELPDGRILSVRGDHVVVSADQGVTWSTVGDTLPFKPAGVSYSVRKKMLFVWHWDCNGVVLDDAIASAGFDYTAE